MYRLSTTNYLVIRMRCGIRDTVGVQVGRGKGLAGWVGFERIAEIYGRIKNRTLRTEGYGTRPLPSKLLPVPFARKYTQVGLPEK